MLNRREALVIATAGAIAGGATAATSPDPDAMIDLWPGIPAGAPPQLPRETVTAGRGYQELRGTARPRLAVFRPASGNGAAMLVIPGGGYSCVVFDKEGYDVARWLSGQGWTAFVLFYRLPGEGWSDRADVPLADAQRAMRLIRSRGAGEGLRRFGAMGFSAGGHLCADLSTRFDTPVYLPVDAADRVSARPDFAAPIYAVQSMAAPLAHPGSRALLLGEGASAELERRHTQAFNVDADTPPMFLAHAEDDGAVPSDNSVELRAALRKAGVPVETHLFAAGGHGFALRADPASPAALWPQMFLRWSARYIA